ncbi:ATP-dependent zinc protease family protein [Lignipirellula cremea]|uniref:Retropepsin-like aspartic endopeptidase domain-containing protein n=1 Tax=Lignipirellula cremea TaxID=2528010 RepID=A0A518E366_9BACT|nr:ATP-dependent zinc protease [Lignipirellula cremea]QDU98512.1 hypothetical protein Pla8534_63810 [Lignipirellula cremea]
MNDSLPPLPPLPLIGWREWLTLPDLEVDRIKAKIDTGARTSSLHAYNVEPIRRDGRDFIRFDIHPVQHNNSTIVTAEAELLEYRLIRSSSGAQSRRPVVVTHVLLHGHCWPIELTLANRDDMGFRMLLGRQAMRGRVVVDPSQSYLSGKPKRKKKK